MCEKTYLEKLLFLSSSILRLRYVACNVPIMIHIDLFFHNILFINICLFQLFLYGTWNIYTSRKKLYGKKRLVFKCMLNWNIKLNEKKNMKVFTTQDNHLCCINFIVENAKESVFMDLLTHMIAGRRGWQRFYQWKRHGTTLSGPLWTQSSFYKMWAYLHCNQHA